MSETAMITNRVGVADVVELIVIDVDDVINVGLVSFVPDSVVFVYHGVNG